MPVALKLQPALAAWDGLGRIATSPAHRPKRLGSRREAR
jgi:hypothetical protein